MRRGTCAIAVLLAVSCRKEPAPPAPAPAPAPTPTPTPAPAPEVLPSDAAVVRRAVRFDCSGFLPRSGAGCAVQPEVPPAAAGLLDAAGRLLAYQALHHAPGDRWASLRAAIDGAAKLPIDDKLAAEARIVLQNAALRIAIYASREQQAALVRAALALADKLALPASTLDRLGRDPLGLQHWLGPMATWRHRDRRNAMTLHAGLNLQMMYFRPVLAGTKRAVFGQLLAFDTAGKPHLTPIVDDLEMRASADPESVACVAELDLVDLLCSRIGLVVVEPASHPQTHFFRRTASGEVECNDCHTADSFPLVPEAAASALIATEIEHALAAAKQAVDMARLSP
ncbi:MAG TPA: hypothetical protein VNO30_15630 [Kofleriaceae bacterium]|nr:hypothetical protein [Kofleriaceae bacterium]